MQETIKILFQGFFRDLPTSNKVAQAKRTEGPRP